MPAASRSSWLVRSTERARSTHNAGRLLLADENPAFLRWYASVLEEAGYEARIALDGQSALPVVVLTSCPERRLLEQARRLCVLDCCVKNLVGPSELRAKIDTPFNPGLVRPAA